MNLIECVVKLSIRPVLILLSNGTSASALRGQGKLNFNLDKASRKCSGVFPMRLVRSLTWLQIQYINQVDSSLPIFKSRNTLQY